MVSSISHASPVQAAQPANQASAARLAQPQSRPQPATSDTVQLSAAASFRQEVTETSAQTAKEASGGDIQAKNLLAREAANAKAGL